MVVIKGGKWQFTELLGQNLRTNSDIELIPPTQDELDLLNVGDEVLVKTKITGFRIGEIIAIPKEEKVKLPSFLKNECLDVQVINTVNSIIDYLKAKESQK